MADLELYQSVIAEKSTCVIKDTEAVILLVKEKKGAWCKLLKNKVKWKLIWELLDVLAIHQSSYFKQCLCQQNVHVSLDFEHWEESEDEGPFTVGKDWMTLCL